MIYKYQQKEKQKLSFMCREWTITCQIFCFASILIILIQAISLSANLALMNISQTIFQNEFPYILNRSSLHQMNQYLQIQKQSSDTFFYDKIQKLKKMNQLFHFVQKKDFAIQPAFECLNNPKLLFNFDLIANVVCCGYTNRTAPHTHPQENEYFLKFNSLLTEVYEMYNFHMPFYASIRDDALFGVYNISRPNINLPTQPLTIAFDNPFKILVQRSYCQYEQRGSHLRKLTLLFKNADCWICSYYKYDQQFKQ